MTSGHRSRRKFAGAIRNRQPIVAVATTCALFAGVIGSAGPASGDDSSWVMPDVRNMILSQAMAQIRAAASPVEITFGTSDTKGNREQYNMSNWSVCWQAPKAGATVPRKDNYVSLGVKRLTDGNCWS